MKKPILIKSSILGFIAISFTAVLTLTSIDFKSDLKDPTITPRYLLSGDFVESNGIFDYYDIGNNELAVSLNDTNKRTYSSTITIPSTYDGKNVTGIWHNAFHCNPATTITFQAPCHINTIDFEAFLYSNISSITIPYTVSDIGDAAFYHCANLTTVTFVNSDQESTGSATTCYCDQNGNPIGSDGGQGGEIHYSGLTVIPSFCFFRCESLTTITLPSSLQEICEEAFNGCYALNSPLYFQNIKIIRSRAFQGCEQLRKVYISKTLFEDANGVGIEPHAFNFCSTAAAPDNLDIVFCGAQNKVTAWVNNHPNWGWRNDVGNPSLSANKYSYRLETGDTYFSADWDYSSDPNGDVTITKYNGPVPNAQTGWFISVPDHMPSPANNRVIRISAEAFPQSVRQVLRRLYLPKTIVAIENNMFNIGTNNTYNSNTGYRELYVVDDNTRCTIDKGLFDSGQEASIQGRIDLSGLTELEFIGYHAFAGIGNGKLNNTYAKVKIQKLRLPAKIRAIGDEAFGIFQSRCLPGVDEFTWDYDDANSRLETIGTDAFYGLGIGSGSETTQISGNSSRKNHIASTIIFPKTFKYFATLAADKTRYKNQAVHPFDFGNSKAAKFQRPAHAFIGCSLLGKVIFKGGEEDETTDLIIPLQTFVYNESLKTIVFEERKNHSITFHTQQSAQNYAQESIGGNSGRGENDFRGEPFLQTLVLPNKYTTLRFQKFCFHANSRAAIYLSSTLGSNMCSDNSGGDGAWTTSTSSVVGDVATFQSADYTLATQWKTIGDETYFESKENSQKYWGYNFTSSKTTNSTNDKSVGTYDIDQQIPVYENVHYKETIDIKGTPSNANDDITVEVGNGNTIEYVEDNYCAFVCGQVGGNYVATMTNYMYSLYDDKSSAQKITAHVPETVTAKIGDTNRTCTVNKIGDSAFSACYCDGKDTSPNLTVGNFDDLRAIELPNTIVSIGDYAFTRAYGVKTISSYTGNGAAVEGMPSSLTHIGKSAFLFSNIEKVLKIPNGCRFYENYPTYPTGVIDDAETPGNPGNTTTSVFSAANNLRQITFIKNGVEGTSSDYYETSIYTSTLAGTPSYTCAVYSKNSNDLTFNKDKLLLVLNRDKNDAKKPSTNLLDCETVTRSGQVKGLRFKGHYKTNPFLYGAFKMGYWILELECGVPTKDSSSNTVPQPIISGVGTRGSNNSTLTTKVIYLGSIGYTYDGLKCDLDTIAGNVLELPQYAMNGCEKLANVELPIRSGGVLPEGVFAGVTNATTTYYVEGDTPTVGTLDLTDSLYSQIGANVFKDNTSIQHLTAPGVSSFTIGSSAFNSCTGLTDIDFSTVTTNLTINSSAFASCTNLTSVDFGDISGSLTIGASAFNGCTKLNSIDFGDVTGSVTINASAFKACGNGPISLDFSKVTGSLTINTGFDSSKVASITWPTSGSCQVKIQTSAFQNCDSLTSVTIPSNLYGDLGESAFNGCDYLTTVTLPSNMTAKIGKNSFYHCDRLANVVVDGSTVGITTINEGAFSNCVALTNFEFSKFTSLATIGKQAFYGSSTLMASGNVVLPASVTSIGEEAFSTSGIVTITIQSSSINLGAKAFANCSSLTAVRFDRHNCSWSSYNNGVFNDCSSLAELQLPTGFNVAMPVNDTYYNGTTKFFIQNDTGVNLYTYTKYIAGTTVSTNGWRKTEAQIEKTPYYYVETVDDLLAAGVIDNTPGITSSASSVHFWMVDANGVAINLGTVTAYDGSTVTFSSGHTLSV